MPRTRSSSSLRPSLALVMLGMILAALWLAGGASREDAAGQIFVRAVAFLALVGLALSGRRPSLADVRPVWFILGAAITIAVLQLFPLPAGSWQALPRRDIVGIAPEPGLWRPLSIVPGATINALGALVVPAAVLLATTNLTSDEKALLPGAVLILVAASMLVGLLQFSGLVLDNPLVNETPGVVSGTFANRNHFALFLALGCLLIPVWTFRDGHGSGWRGPAGFGLLLLFTLTILATGSRAGMVVGALAIVIAAALSWRGLRRELRHAPRWVLPAIIAAAVGILVALVSISVFADRAVSIQRSMSVDIEQDMRSRAFPTVSGMTRAVFPAGAGLGSFDPAFRTHEPTALLKPTYFNQAHNDFIEIVFGAGLPGALLLVVALAWWLWRSVTVWSGAGNRQAVFQRLGSAMLLLILVASLFDYPARTPLIMAMTVLAGIWLSKPSEPMSALPGAGGHLLVGQP